MNLTLKKATKSNGTPVLVLIGKLELMKSPLVFTSVNDTFTLPASLTTEVSSSSFEIKTVLGNILIFTLSPKLMIEPLGEEIGKLSISCSITEVVSNDCGIFKLSEDQLVSLIDTVVSGLKDSLKEDFLHPIAKMKKQEKNNMIKKFFTFDWMPAYCSLLPLC